MEEKKNVKKELEEKLEKGIRDCLDSENFKNYLKTISKFHRYSLNNCILITIQRPDASFVASFNKWKEMGRSVKKGEKGIAIITPMPRKKKLLEVKEDESGNQTTEEVEKKYLTFGKGYVFDVKQTEGKELPSICKELSGEVSDYEIVIGKLCALSPCPTEFEDTGSEAKGYFSPDKNIIVVQKGMSQLQTVKTLLHEIAHARLGHGEKECSLTRSEKELEAEATAFTVADYLGLDTSEYSFEYLATWGSPESLKKHMEAIKDCAGEIIDEYEGKPKMAA